MVVLIKFWLKILIHLIMLSVDNIIYYGASCLVSFSSFWISQCCSWFYCSSCEIFFGLEFLEDLSGLCFVVMWPWLSMKCLTVTCDSNLLFFFFNLRWMELCLIIHLSIILWSTYTKFNSVTRAIGFLPVLVSFVLGSFVLGILGWCLYIWFWAYIVLRNIMALLFPFGACVVPKAWGISWHWTFWWTRVLYGLQSFVMF